MCVIYILMLTCDYISWVKQWREVWKEPGVSQNHPYGGENPETIDTRVTVHRGVARQQAGYVTMERGP